VAGDVAGHLVVAVAWCRCRASGIRDPGSGWRRSGDVLATCWWLVCVPLLMGFPAVWMMTVDDDGGRPIRPALQVMAGSDVRGDCNQFDECGGKIRKRNRGRNRDRSRGQWSVGNAGWIRPVMDLVVSVVALTCATAVTEAFRLMAVADMVGIRERLGESSADGSGDVVQ
jgi:hypothetical protein